MIIDRIPHSSLDEVSSFKYNMVINCTIDPSYKTSPYSEDIDTDLKIARLFPNSDQIMISSRKVYGTNDDLLTYTESSPYNPTDNYGWNKMTTEIAISKLKDNYTILRGSNIYGFELGRKSFLGFCLNQLKENNSIIYDYDYSTKRDFISVESVCAFIKKICETPIYGIYNLSSNIATEIGQVGQRLIDGYGNGVLVTDNNVIKDQFILDNSKLLQGLGIDAFDFDLENNMIEVGKQLCKI